MDNLRRRIWFITSLFILVGLLIAVNLFNFARVGNPVAVGAAICKLQFAGADIAQFEKQPEKYIIKAEQGCISFIRIMNQRGWTLKEQKDNRLVFRNTSSELMANSRVQGDFQVIILDPVPRPVKTPLRQITLTAAGDILMHNTQIASGLQADGTYRFDSFFAPVKKLLEEGDYCSTNFEAALAGPEQGYTGYPIFNSPDAISDTMKEAGFDLVVTANNHCLDRGYRGGVRTLEVLHKAGLDTVGTYASLEDSRKFLVKDINGVKVAYLAYTYSTNGIPVPDQHSYFVNMLEPSRVISDIKKVRPYTDIIVLVLHWGVEYNPEATREQKEMALKFFKAGADVILGSHPHVIEPMEVMRVDGVDKFVIYSMGNFISHQRGLERNSGVVMKLKFIKAEGKGTLLKSVSYTPTFSHSYKADGRLQFRVVPVEETINRIQAGKEPYLDQAYLPVLKAVLDGTCRQLGPNHLDLNK